MSEPLNLRGAFRRPASLLQVSEIARADRARFDNAVAEFLDEFYVAAASRRTPMLAEQPVALGTLPDAYLAAVAEHLARRHGMEPPAWSETQGFGLTRPWFAGSMESLKAILTVESPTAFRRRLLFVSRNALSRASERVERDGE